MFLDIVEKIVDRSIQLIKHRQELKHALFDEHINPIFDSFEIAHKQYIENFKRYRDIIYSSTEPLNEEHSVLKLIKSDNIFTADQRAKILSLSESLDKTEYKNFIQSIYNYLVFSQQVSIDKASMYTEDIPAAMRLQRWRTRLLSLFHTVFYDANITDIEKRNIALRAVNYVVEGMQEEYAQVLQEYSKLRKQLLR